MTQSPTPSDDEHAQLVRRHQRVGWWGLALFVVVGVALESLHGFKVSAYLSQENETRRLMWRLGHAHGALLCIVNLVFSARPGLKAGQHARLASLALCLATLLLPGGFLLGGAVIYQGDPGLGIVLVPIGAVCLLLALVLSALDA